MKIGFSEFSQKVSFLRHMLLSKSYINVVIAVVLSKKSSLYDLQRPTYPNGKQALKGGLENRSHRVQNAFSNCVPT